MLGYVKIKEVGCEECPHRAGTIGMKAAGVHTLEPTQVTSGRPHVNAGLRQLKCAVCSTKRGHADALLTVPSMHNAEIAYRALALTCSALQTCNAHRSTPLAARLAERLRTVARPLPPPNGREIGVLGGGGASKPCVVSNVFFELQPAAGCKSAWARGTRGSRRPVPGPSHAAIYLCNFITS